MIIRGHIKNGVAVLDDAANLPEGTAVRIEVDDAYTSFWCAKTLTELASEQSVKSSDDLAGSWHADESVDEFLASMR